MIGQRIGTYRIVRELGRGGMGSVYEAVREDIGRRVAIKVLLAQHSADPQVAARFFLEARAVSIINHPGLVSIHEHGMTPDGLAYLVMEFLDGKTLRQRIAEGPPLLSASLPLIAQAAQALAATHQKQIVHRDISIIYSVSLRKPQKPIQRRRRDDVDASSEWKSHILDAASH